jgi:hypothetical protein
MQAVAELHDTPSSPLRAVQQVGEVVVADRQPGCEGGGTVGLQPPGDLLEMSDGRVLIASVSGVGVALGQPARYLPIEEAVWSAEV